MTAFTDTWQWSTRRYEELSHDPQNQTLLPLMESLYGILGTSEMMAYLVMMAPRLMELQACAEAHRQPVFALRPYREPLSENAAGHDLPSPLLSERDHLEAHEYS